jgi:uncharacterized membrane protein
MGKAKTKVYKFSTADYPGADYSEVFDTDGATSVGAFAFSDTTGPLTAFTVKGNVYRILDVPGSQFSFATAINSSGLIGGSYLDLSSAEHGFVDNAGTFTNIDYPGALGTEVLDINDAGVIVGDYFDTAAQHGYVDNGGVFTPIDFPGALDGTSATGVNSNGDIVGTWKNNPLDVHGFLLSGGVFTSLDFPFAFETEVWGINDSGEISGFFDDATGVHGFIYSHGAWNKVDVAGARGTQLFRSANSGAVAGQAFDHLNESHGIRGR